MVRVSKQHSVQLASKAALVALILSSTALTPARLKAAELPTGGSVAAGQASIASSGPAMLIDQSSQNAIINWNSFSIGNGRTVTFNNGSGATLNRVTGTDVSGIHGTLNATGSLFLINQNGIVIGKDGVVNTGGSFVASTLDVRDEDFLDGGDLTFSGDSAASITNLGKVGSLGGDVAFIARHIVNEGELSAPNGTVGLAAGREVLMRDASLDDGRFLVKVGDANSSITEAGVISAASVELRANGGNIYALAGNTGGAINATGVSNSGGRIFLTAGSGKVRVAKKVRATRKVSGKRSGGSIFVNADVVNIAGLIEADGETGKGGKIDIGGREIALNGALLDASGLEGGGRIRVGGEFQGGKGLVTDEVENAETLLVDQASLLTADGTGAWADGGTIIAWADDATSFAGRISATGSNDGGFAEVSGKTTLDYSGIADLRGADGANGTLLLDPTDFTIGAAEASTITTNLVTANVVVATDSAGGGNGDIFVNAAIAYSSANGLTLLAHRHIEANANIQNDGSGALNLVAGWDGATQAPGAAGINPGAAFDINTLIAAPASYGNSSGSVFIGDGTQASGIAVGSRNGTTTVLGEDLTLTGGNANNAHAQLGYRTISSTATASGSFNIDLTGGFTAEAGAGGYAYAQIGHGGGDVSSSSGFTSSFSGSISLEAQSVALTGSGSGGRSYAQIGHGGNFSEGDSSGTITVQATGDIALTGGGSVGYAQIGHGGRFAQGDHTGVVNVTAGGDLTLVSGTDFSAFAQIGNGGFDNPGTASGPVNVSVTGTTLLATRGIHTGNYTMIGSGEAADGFAVIGSDANITPAGGVSILARKTLDIRRSLQVNGSGAVNLVGGWNGSTGLDLGTHAVDMAAIETASAFGAIDGDVIIGDGNQTSGIALGSRFGTTTVLARNLSMQSRTAGIGGSTQIGFQGAASGDIAVQLTGDLSMTGGLQYGHTLIGHGGIFADDDHSGNITVEAAGDLAVTAGDNYAWAQIGHGAYYSTLGTNSGNIIVAANNVSLSGGISNNAHAQIGHGGHGASGDKTGDVILTAGGTLALTGGGHATSYAQIGHGSASFGGSGPIQGDISAIVGGMTTLTGNTGDYWIGHATTTAGGISNADVALVTGGLSVTGGDFAGMIRNNLIGGDVLIANRLPQIADADPFNPDLSDDIVHAGSNNAYDVETDHSLTLAATGEVTFEHGLQIDGTGDINLLSGWDGTTGLDLSGFPALDMATVETAGAFGATSGTNGDNGDVNIGDGSQNMAIRVGTRDGDIHVLAHDLEIKAGGNYDGAQLGANIGGHGSATGNIRVSVMDDVIVQGGNGNYADALIGHSHQDGSGALSGDITILGDTAGNNNEIIVAGGDGLLAFGQIGHANFDGEASGKISIFGEHIYVGDNRGSFAGGPGALAQVGHLGVSSAVSGDISIAASGQVVVVGGDGPGTFAIIGHDGADVSGEISVNAGWGVYVVGGDDEDAWAQIGHYAGTAIGNIGVSGETLEVLGGNGLGATAQIGHFTDFLVNGNLTLAFTDTVELIGGDAEGAAAFIGHDGYGDATGDITLDVGEVLLQGGRDESTEVQIGHANSVDPFLIGGTSNVSGNISVKSAGHVRILGGEATDAYAQIGHGLIGSDITAINGNIDVMSGGSLQLLGGINLGTYAQIGHGGYFTFATAAGDISVEAMGHVAVVGGSGDYSTGQIGHGGLDYYGDVSGTIAVTSHGAAGPILPVPTILVSTLNGKSSFGMIGHGGQAALGAKSGDITVTMAGAGTQEVIGLFGGSNINTSAQIGHGGIGSAGEMSGDIGLSSTGDVMLLSGSGSLAWARIGHGPTTGDAAGNITVIAAGEASLEDGAGGAAWIGHETGGTVSDAEVFLQAFGFDRSITDTLAAGDLGAFNKDILLADIPAGDFTLIATGSGLVLEDPIYSSPYRVLVSVNNDLVLNPGAVFVNSGTGDIIFAAGGDFHNDTGSLTPVVTGGRWLIYSTRPDNNRNDIEITNRDFLRYSTPFDLNDPVPAAFPAGAGLVYSVTPVVNLAASDEIIFFGQALSPTITRTVSVNGVTVNPAEFGLDFDLSGSGFSYGGNVAFAAGGVPLVGFYPDGLIPNGGLVTSYYGILSSSENGDLTVTGNQVNPLVPSNNLVLSRVEFGLCSPSEDDLRKAPYDENTGELCTLLPAGEE